MNGRITGTAVRRKGLIRVTAIGDFGTNGLKAMVEGIAGFELYRL